MHRLKKQASIIDFISMYEGIHFIIAKKEMHEHIWNFEFTGMKEIVTFIVVLVNLLVEVRQPHRMTITNVYITLLEEVLGQYYVSLWS